MNYRTKVQSLAMALVVLAAMATPAFADQQSSKAFTGSAQQARNLHRKMQTKIDTLPKATPLPVPIPSRGQKDQLDEEGFIGGFGTVTRKADGKLMKEEATPAVKEDLRKSKPTPPAEQPEPILKPRKVFGSDERVFIGDTTRYPFRTFGLVVSTYPGGAAGWCSGTLISKRHVLTAAHCLFDVSTLTWPSTVSFYPGRNGSYAPYGAFRARQWHVLSGFVDDPDTGYTLTRERYDLGVITLERQAGNSLGWLGFGYNESLPTFDANIVGYPGDKPSATMWRTSCPVDASKEVPYFFRIFCDIYAGNSGSATYDYEPSDQTRLIRGVAISESSDKNHSLRIGRGYFEWLCERTQCTKTR